MAEWIRIAHLAECPPGSVLERIAGDRVVALANVEGELLAIDGVCPHQGGPLGKGELRGPILTCPWHGWQFDLRTGAHCLNPRLKHPCFRVRIEKESIYVLVDEETLLG